MEHSRFPGAWELPAPVHFRGMTSPAQSTAAHGRVPVQPGGTHLVHLKQLEQITQKYTQTVHTQHPLETYLIIVKD